MGPEECGQGACGPRSMATGPRAQPHRLHGCRQRLHRPRHLPPLARPPRPPWLRGHQRQVPLPFPCLPHLLSLSHAIVSPAHTASFTPADLDLRSGRFGDHSVRRVFLDPCSKHCFATVIHPGGAEMCYPHSRWGHRAHMLMGLWQSSRPLSWQSSPLSVDFVQTLIPFLFLIFLICSINFVDLVVQKQVISVPLLISSFSASNSSLSHLLVVVLLFTCWPIGE